MCLESEFLMRQQTLNNSPVQQSHLFRGIKEGRNHFPALLGVTVTNDEIFGGKPKL